MPKRDDIQKILLIGSGPIIIGQACEFDYSGTQACKALAEEGYTVVLVNSNPATIMTDPETAAATYIEPLTLESVTKVIEKERPDALLPTLGGQTALNLAVELADAGVLEKFGVDLIGANREAIRKAEDRREFKGAMERIGMDIPRSEFVYSLEDAVKLEGIFGYPVILRPSFTLGGTGAGIAYNREEFEDQVQWGLAQSPINEVLVEESVIGWKEYELEVMRDLHDNVVVICSIENFDPMGIHTGDSITVAPAQTLTDREYQDMRDDALAVIREIGVDTGGSNIQFAVHPKTGRRVVIEMNPRVSRSSALASKATGFPIAKIAAKLAIGLRLDEIPNDITRDTPACFEPTIDYCVVKIPRWAFEKFPAADPSLGVQMKSVGETMAIGRTFKEALQKGIRSLEIDRYGLGSDGKDMVWAGDLSQEEVRRVLRKKLLVATEDRLFHIKEALVQGISVGEIAEITGIDPWFVDNMRQIVEMEQRLRENAIPKRQKLSEFHVNLLESAKEFGFSDRQLAYLWDSSESEIRALRKKHGIEATFKLVDTCAAEFEAHTPYYYSTYSLEDETRESKKKKVMILGGGPNRIGQGIEFDYCCVHAALALREDGFETIMVNSNPETVSTDYDISDRLYFEPLTLEDVLNIHDREKPWGVIVQFGGQTPLKLAIPLQEAGVPILGTTPDSIDRAEDRKRFKQILNELGLRQSPNDTATSIPEARRIAAEIGYPVLVRPSYVLGGRAMEIVFDEKTLTEYMKSAVEASFEHPVLIDKFLEDATEIDVDAISDGERVVIGGIMEHIEYAGVHSGDSACVLPPTTIPQELIDSLVQQTKAMAIKLNVIGLINIQFAIKDGQIYVLEVNPRASRTVPFVSKAIGVPLAKLAARVMTGKTLEELEFTKQQQVPYCSVKEAVLPFVKFPGVDTILGPEMKSTGEVMGIASDFGTAFAKSQISADTNLPKEGGVFISVSDRDKAAVLETARKFAEMGFNLIATSGTAAYLSENGLTVQQVYKVNEGRPNVVDRIKTGEIHLIINTPLGRASRYDEKPIRRTAVERKVPCFTTLAAAAAAADGIRSLQSGELTVQSLQEYHRLLKGSALVEKA